MKRIGRHTSGLVFVGALAALAGCGKRTADDQGPVVRGQPSAAPPITPRIDHLAPGEMLEGKVNAFALKLPRDYNRTVSVRRTVSAEGPGKPEDVTNYIRARVRSGDVHVGASSTRFVNVRVPEEPERMLNIAVEPDFRPGRVRVIVEDVTPLPEPPPDQRDPVSRMKSVGLTMDGKPIDPKRFE
jgi:hypothetical protein